MIIGHEDSHGNRWYFRVDASREIVGRIARKLWNKASRVRAARTNSERARALLAEAVALNDFQAYNGVTVEEWDATPHDERFVL